MEREAVETQSWWKGGDLKLPLPPSLLLDLHLLLSGLPTKPFQPGKIMAISPRVSFAGLSV